jgi:hypothetical protein
LTHVPHYAGKGYGWRYPTFGASGDRSLSRLQSRVLTQGTASAGKVGLVKQNYLENRARYQGIGNYNDEGFAAMEKAIGTSLAVFKNALAVRNLKIVFGTDAVAGLMAVRPVTRIEKVKIPGNAS